MSVGLETQNPNLDAYGSGLSMIPLLSQTTELGDVFGVKDDIFGLSHR